MELTGFVQALRASTADLLLGLADEGWRDTDLAAPSLCADWTRGDVLTHLARNADGITATVSGALRGEIVPRYPNGVAGRDADIAAGADRPLLEILADLKDSADRLDRVFTAAGEAGAWDAETERELPASHWPARRWREVEIHRVDLLGSYTPRQWPPAFVRWLLPEIAASLPERSAEPLRVTVTEEGSVGSGHPGESFGADDGATEVRGPDWAVLAWMLGRVPQQVSEALTATPDLAPWS